LNACFPWRNFSQSGPDLRFDGVVLVLRQGHRRQDADDGHDDHQLDQGETLLLSAFHKKTPVEKRNK
jgi:hypothetical protein